jgi:hypothetical protein
MRQLSRRSFEVVGDHGNTGVVQRDGLARRPQPPKRATISHRITFGRSRPRTAPLLVTVVPVVDEPTWDVRPPGKGGRRIDRRTRLILTVAVVAAIVVNAGAAWAYWRLTASAAGVQKAGTAVELALRGRSDLNRPLVRGGVGNLTVTVTNDNSFPVRISSVVPGTATIVADDEHRENGCPDSTGVTATHRDFPVSWVVARNTLGAFTIPAGLRMARDANPACEGASFTIPIQVGVVSATS